MDLLRHWHPVCLSRELTHRPRRVWLGGVPYAVFRTDGVIGALPDACPHRGMRLSTGRVRGGQLVCPYHGWAFGPDGVGKAPGTPQMRPHTACLEAVERDGAIWMRRPGATGPFPAVGPGGFHPVSVTRHRAAAPLEATMDNFTEVEHTGAVHWMLGYAPEAAEAVQVEVTARPDAVRVYNRGPQRPLPAALRALIGLGPADDFIDDWTSYFSPVHTLFEQYWIEGGTEARRPATVRIGVVYTPVHDDVTDIYTFVHTNAEGSGPRALALRLMLRAFAEVEVRLDASLLGRLEEGRGGLEGRRLGRFDKALRLQRQRIERLYRGPA
ncbi:MAG: Rieske 2Fe-2S domain-containing protein [Myxococcales bacterium]|nr:Rieske 2Fe-2S domain-containing protein [Myxococcales bacterium]